MSTRQQLDSDGYVVIPGLLSQRKQPTIGPRFRSFQASVTLTSATSVSNAPMAFRETASSGR